MLYLNMSRRFRGNTCGVAAIEFAIVANAFLLLVVAIAGFGVYLSAAHSLEQMAAETSRLAIRGLTDAERESIARERIMDTGDDYPFLDADKVITQIVMPDADTVQVILSYNTADLPILGMLPFIDMPAGMVNAQATIRL